MKVNLGCGSEILEGWVNVDVKKLKGVDVVCDIRDLSQFEDESWDECRMSHVIEHIVWDEAVMCLEQVYVKLKHGGKLAVYCPNAFLIAWDYVNYDIDTKEFRRLLFGNPGEIEDLHKMVLCPIQLKELVQSAGFEITGKEPRPHAYRYDMGVQAVKP